MTAPSTHCIILAQGNQSRLGDMRVPKCLLPLPACGGRPILYRTLRQVWSMFPWAPLDAKRPQHQITIVGWHEVGAWFEENPVVVPHMRHPDGSEISIAFTPQLVSLADPGNSSLKGIARYLAQAKDAHGRDDFRGADWPARTVVLLGDTIYSWACLRELFAEPVDDLDNVRFAVSHDLSPGAGELWGIRWGRSADALMMSCLDRALAKHPKFEEYQPGQLRSWLWEVDVSLGLITPRPWVGWSARRWRHETDPSDYIMDIDVPEHIPLIGPASERAAADDEAHGVTWR